jgi:UPF0755 protein
MAKTASKRNISSKKKKGIGIAFIILLVIAIGGGLYAYKKIYKPNVHVENEKGNSFLYIHTGSSFEQVLSSLTQNKYLQDPESFQWMAVKMNYTNNVKPGKYKIKDGMSNRELITMLRAGNQTPIKLTFNNIRLKNKLASDVSKQIEADSTDILNLLNDDAFLSQFNLDKQTVVAMFIPNTYEMYWNTSAEDFLKKMYKEYDKFWNDKRTAQAKSIGFTPVQISIIASIVEEESQNKKERPTIAGVYINRLNKGMLLQADPTVKFAVGDFTIKRVLDKHIAFDSPYNTYKYKGLPPGPICVPSISAIESVLNYEKHEYIYFCAKEDFSGSHNFARTIEQHNKNADKYRAALNRNKIMK